MNGPRVASIDIFPKGPTVPLPGMKQQMTITAKFTDGGVRDVTAETFIESSNTEIAKRLMDAMDIPAWLKKAMRLKFPWINQYSTLVHNGARANMRSIEFARGDPRPADARSKRIKDKALIKYQAVLPNERVKELA